MFLFLIGFHWVALNPLPHSNWTENRLVRERDSKVVCIVLPHNKSGFFPMCEEAKHDFGIFPTREKAQVAAETWVENNAR